MWKLRNRDTAYFAQGYKRHFGVQSWTLHHGHLWQATEQQLDVVERVNLLCTIGMFLNKTSFLSIGTLFAIYLFIYKIYLEAQG